ncbi:MAG: PEP-CTERM sorting domain-containing protein [Isosphaeraceae bacterium]|nr:PEP-CTERM sorting domain-containing protein [Isosphaeraceae bacterium]
MRSFTCLSVALLGCLVVAGETARAEFFTPISLADSANGRIQSLHPEYPSGTGVDLGGVPFDIPSVGPNTWFATFASGGTSASVSKTIPIGMTGVTGVHTLINTLWGRAGTPSLASLTFTYDDGSTFVKPLVGDSDIRDYYQNVFTNTINNTTTFRVFFTDTDGPAGPNRYRLDKQFVDLAAFSSKTLVSMRLNDFGNELVQRTFISGLTVQTVPEPSALALTALGGAALLIRLRRSSTRRAD